MLQRSSLLLTSIPTVLSFRFIKFRCECHMHSELMEYILFRSANVVFNKVFGIAKHSDSVTSSYAIGLKVYVLLRKNRALTVKLFRDSFCCTIKESVLINKKTILSDLFTKSQYMEFIKIGSLVFKFCFYVNAI